MIDNYHFQFCRFLEAPMLASIAGLEAPFDIRVLWGSLRQCVNVTLYLLKSIRCLFSGICSSCMTGLEPTGILLPLPLQLPWCFFSFSINNLPLSSRLPVPYAAVESRRAPTCASSPSHPKATSRPRLARGPSPTQSSPATAFLFVFSFLFPILDLYSIFHKFYLNTYLLTCV